MPWASSQASSQVVCTGVPSASDHRQAVNGLLGAVGFGSAAFTSFDCYRSLSRLRLLSLRSFVFIYLRVSFTRSKAEKKGLCVLRERQNHEPPRGEFGELEFRRTRHTTCGSGWLHPS